MADEVADVGRDSSRKHPKTHEQSIAKEKQVVVA